MKAPYIRACVAAWLRYKRQCPIVAFERGLSHRSVPDVLAVNDSRYFVEVEIKVSIADLRRDFKKRKFRLNGLYAHVPRMMYYAVPPAIKEKALPIVPEGAGLLTLKEYRMYGLQEVCCVKRAKPNAKATRATVKEVIQMVKHQSGTICSLAAAIAEEA